MYQQYKCLYISGVETLRDLIEDLISIRKQTLPASFCSYHNYWGLDSVSKPYLVSESLVGRNMQGKVKLSSGNRIWKEGKP